MSGMKDTLGDRPYVLPEKAFDGKTYEASRDFQRLGEQAKRVFKAMADGGWSTLHQLAQDTGDPEASISARLRDFRKPKWGGFTIEREYAGNGLHRYRLVQRPT